MSKNYFKNDYKRKKSIRKSQRSIKISNDNVCRCCKKSFRSQGRFSNSDIKYRDYCSECREICYMCRCRHGGRGNTCSKYCADRYKKLRWLWKNHYSSKSLNKLDKLLTKFDLTSIHYEILKPLFGLETTFIQNRCKGISETMMVLQDHRKLESIDDKLIINENLYIDKNKFYIYENSICQLPIENYK